MFPLARRLFLFAIFVFSFFTANATLVGGEITWQYLGGDSFKFYVALYQDCNTTVNPVSSLRIVTGCGNTFYKSLSLSSTSDITRVCRYGTTRCANKNSAFPYGVNKMVYTATIDLSPYKKCCNFTFIYSECCRSNGKDSFYIESKLNTCLAGYYSSPASTDPMIYQCLNRCTSLSYFAMGNSGDSISYSLTSALKSSGVSINYDTLSYKKPVWYPDSDTLYSPPARCSRTYVDQNGLFNIKTAAKGTYTIAVKKTIWHKDAGGKMVVVGETTKEHIFYVIDCATRNFTDSAEVLDFCAGRNNTALIRLGGKDSGYVNRVVSSGFPNSTLKALTNSTYLFTWKPLSNDVRSFPYHILFTYYLDNCTDADQYSRNVNIYVGDSFPQLKWTKTDSSCGIRKYSIASSYFNSRDHIRWYLNQIIADSSLHYVFIPNRNGTFFIRGDFYNKSGCHEYYYDTVSVSNLTGIKGPHDTLVCKGTRLMLKATGAGSYYSWDILNGKHLSDSAQYSFIADSTRYLVVSNFNKNGSRSYDTVKVIVPLLSFSVSRDTAVCTGSTLTLFATGSNIKKYSWSPRNIASMPDSETTAVTVVKTTLFTVSVTDSNGCVFNKPVKVSVLQMHGTGGPDKAICYGDSVQLQGSGAISYTWVNLSSGKRSLPDPYVSPLTTTDYIVKLIDSTGCIYEDTVHVKVGNVTLKLIPDQNICQGLGIKLSASGGGKYYLWRPGKDLNDSTSASPIAKPLVTTSYTVWITDSLHTCTKTATVKVVVDDCVYPGDADQSHYVDYMDALYIGVGFGIKGPGRLNPSIKLIGQHCADWMKTTATGINYKHIDCDGNGKVDLNDTKPVYLNMGLWHPKRDSASQKNGNPLYFRFSKDTFYAGDTVRASVFVNHNSGFAPGLYGLFFDGTYFNKFIEPGTFNFGFSCTDLCSKNDTNLTKYNQDIVSFFALAERTDHSGSPGKIKIADISYVLSKEPSLYSKRGDWISLKFGKTVDAVDSSATQFPLKTLDDSAMVFYSKPTGVEETDRLVEIRLYPNPANSSITVESGRLINQWQITDLVGRKIASGKAGSLRFEIPFGEIRPGAYFLECYSGNSVVRETVVVQH